MTACRLIQQTVNHGRRNMQTHLKFTDDNLLMQAGSLHNISMQHSGMYTYRHGPHFHVGPLLFAILAASVRLNMVMTFKL